ncbi:similar to coiled-coil domain containing 111 [Ectocarpus siliculosus]|uniref:DNA-directed primase/polymerase protein n=1 Tax=Ectocarpus siliculosus TaxID=2880 RepID=D8LSB0_ECTSI|nr:similar to coiled-coil domain containing 111 [Ectocarpus siliculosus]|eukprot:CBN75167.1 similar to coiled-coil domain containing 111 [Ectocarpus siliculosus]
MASTAALEQEEFDDAFWREVDAAEAAAVLEQQGQSTRSNTSTVAENLSPTMTPPQQRSKQETRHKDGSNVQGMLRYRWKVASISVHGDGSKIEEEWIGEGELEVHCRQVSPSGAIQVENVVVTADGGGGSAMDIPRHAIENRDMFGTVEFPIARPSALTSGKDVGGMLLTTVDRTPRVASSTDNNQRHECGDSTVALDRGQVLSSGRKGEDAEEEVAAAAAGLSSGGEKAYGETHAAVTNASTRSTKAAERWHEFDNDAARDGGARDYGDSVERKKVRRVAEPNKEERAAVPDGEWRRPLVASPPNRRRAAAGRRRPKVRDGARNRNGRVVVLRLHDDDDNDREAPTSGAAISPAASSRGSSVRRARAAVHDIGVGVGVCAGVGEDQQQPEVGEHPRKRLLPVESLAHPSNESLSGKRNKALPPPQPRSLHTAAGVFRGSRSKGESSWLALRQALHERYRDSVEHGAAEQTAAEAAEHGRGGRAGSSKGGRGGCGGEVMSPGIRVFRRQDHAFTYVDALAARLAAEDAARYRVLSFETSATGSRKFVVCDIRRFEERYPYTALPDPSLLRHLHLPDPTHHRQPGSPSSPLPPPPPQSTPPHVPSSPAIAEDSSNRGECDSNPGDGRNTGDSVRSPATTTTPSPMSLEPLEPPQPAAFPAPRPDGSGVSSVGPVCEKPSHPPCPCPSSPPPRPSPLRHMYEIIREGRPCRMYFDLEFARGPNPGLDGEELVCAWINVVAGKLHQEFGVSVGTSNVLDLDSSTPKKFSRHLIFHLPGDQLFLDNSHVGRFVNSLAAELESWRAPQSPSTPATPPGIGRDDIVPTATAAAAVAVPHCVIRSGGGNAGGGDHLGGTPSSDDFPTSAVPVPTVATAPRDGDGDSSTGSTPTTATAPTTAKADCSNDDKTNGGGGGGGGAGALERLWVKDGDGRRVLFADVSVYTRNRCFRLLGSSKFGKAACLRVAATNKRTLDHMVWRGRGGGTFARTSSSSLLSPREQKQQLRDVARTLLHDSLVVPVTPRSSPAELFLTVGGGTGQHRYSRFGSCRKQTGDCSSSQQRQQHGWSTNGTISAERGEHRGSSQDHGSGSSDGDGWRVSSQGFGPSPFPAVDSFLRTLVGQGGTRGELRQWSYTAGQVPPRTVEHDHQEGNGNGNGSGNAGGTGLVSPGSQSAPQPPATVVRKLTHQVANNRWCWNIGRAHKSNHVFLVTDLSRGEVRQHCHDQECRRSGYRSNPVRLPIGVAPLEDDLEAFELELGLAAAMRESPADWAAVA